MAYTEAQKRATLKYQREKLAQLNIRMTPEECDIIKSAAAAAGKSLRQYIVDIARKETP